MAATITPMAQASADRPQHAVAGTSLDDRPINAAEDLVFRRGKLRKRDDPAIDIFREALAHIRDISRVKRLLLELGRLYNPVTNGPILQLPARRRIVELLEAGAEEEARGFLHEYSAAYARRPEGQPQTGSEEPGEGRA
jgi:hypothetical protein